MPTRELHDVVYQDIIAQMEHLEKHNYPLPKEYDKNKHDISDNEIRLYEQQLQRDKHRDSKKVSGMIAISATCLSQFCQLMQIDYLKTKNLPKLIREAIADGEFDDYMEGLGEYLRGSVVDHPIFSIALKFVEKVGEAHNMETEEEQERLEEEEAQREKRHAESLRSLNKLRVPNVPSPKYTKKNAPQQVSESSDSRHVERKSEMKVDTRPKREKRVVIDEEKVEKEKIFKQEQEKKRLQAEREIQRKEQARLQEEQEKLKKQFAEQKKLEEKLEQEKLEQEKLQQEKLQQEKLQKQNTEQEKLQKEQTEQEKLEQEKLEQEKLQKQSTEPKKGKKGFKRCTDLALPKGMEKLMENLQAPMKEMKAMMTDDQQIVEEEQSAQQGFHNVSF